MWEFFQDKSYFDLWAVRRGQDIFHVQTRDEAITLSATLNGYELGCSAVWNVDKGH